MRNILFLVLFFAWSFQAHSSGLGESYIAKTTQVLNSLEKAGINRIACNIKDSCLFISDLKKSLAQVKFEEVDGISKPEFATRRMAFYSAATQTIYLNRNNIHPSEVVGYLGFHELLGVHGIEELDYQLTLIAVAVDKLMTGQWNFRVLKPRDLMLALQGSAYTMTGPNNRSSVTDSNSIMIPMAGGGLSSGGSVTSIGGGAGDGDALLQRILFYEFLLKFGNPPFLRYVFIFSIAIEIVDQESSAVEYVFGNDPTIPRHILVPRNLLSRQPGQPLSPALQDILWFFTSVGQYVFMFPHMKIEYQLMIGEGVGKDFWYPKDPSKVHPAVMGRFFNGRFEKYCVNQKCRKATRWEEFLRKNLQN